MPSKVIEKLAALALDFVDRGGRPSSKPGSPLDQLKIVASAAAAIVAALAAFSQLAEPLFDSLPRQVVSLLLSLIVVSTCLAVIAAKEAQPKNQLIIAAREGPPGLSYAYPQAIRQLAKVLTLGLLIFVIPRSLVGIIKDASIPTLVVAQVTDSATGKPVEGAVLEIFTSDGRPVPAKVAYPSDSDGILLQRIDVAVRGDATLRVSHRNCEGYVQELRKRTTASPWVLEHVGLIGATEQARGEEEDIAFYQIQMRCEYL